MDSRYKCLFQDVALAEELCLFKVSQLRYSTFAIALGPPTHNDFGKETSRMQIEKSFMKTALSRECVGYDLCCE